MGKRGEDEQGKEEKNRRGGGEGGKRKIDWEGEKRIGRGDKED